MHVFIYIIIFFTFFDLFTQLPIMSPMATSLGATPFLTGLAVGMFSLSNVIGNISAGFLTDRKGPSTILIAGLLLTSVSLFLYQFVGNPYLLLLVRFVHGLAAGFIYPAAFTYTANTSSQEKKGKSAAISGAFIGLAAITGPAFSGMLASRTNETSVLTCTAYITFLLSICSLFFLKKRIDIRQTKVQQEGLSVRNFFGSPPVYFAFIGAFFLMFSQGVLAYMLPLKVIDLGSNTQTSGMLMSTFGLIAVFIFIFPTNRLFDRLKPISMMNFGMATMGVSLILISIGQNLSTLYITMGLYGTGFAFLFPSINSLLIGATNETNRGRAYGYFYAFFSFGVVVGSGLTGWLKFSANEGFLFTGILLIIVNISLYVQNRVNKVSA